MADARDPSPRGLPAQSAPRPTAPPHGGPLCELPGEQRPGASPSPGARPHESAFIASVVRRELQAAEAKLSGQIARVHDDLAAVMDRTDRLREAAIQRLEQRVLSHEGLQFQLDRKISELNGAFRGLAEEMQLQFRRSDAVEARYREFRQQLEEDFRETSAASEEANSKCRAITTSTEDGQKMLAQNVSRLDSWFKDHRKAFQEHMKVVDQRLGRYEQRLDVAMATSGLTSMAAKQQLDPAPMALPRVADDRLWQVERRLGEVGNRITDLSAQAASQSGTLEEHKMKLRIMEIKLEGQTAKPAVLVSNPKPRSDLWEISQITLPRASRAGQQDSDAATTADISPSPSGCEGGISRADDGSIRGSPGCDGSQNRDLLPRDLRTSSEQGAAHEPLVPAAASAAAPAAAAVPRSSFDSSAEIVQSFVADLGLTVQLQQVDDDTECAKLQESLESKLRQMNDLLAHVETQHSRPSTPR